MLQIPVEIQPSSTQYDVNDALFKFSHPPGFGYVATEMQPDGRSSVADPRCISRIRTFSITDPVVKNRRFPDPQHCV